MLFLVLAALFLAGGEVAANGASVPPVQLVCLQALLWLVGLLPLARRPRGPVRWLVVQGLANLTFFLLNVTALQHLPVTWATAILSGGTPFCVLLVSFVLFRRLPSWRVVGLLVVVLAGVLLMSRDTPSGVVDLGVGVPCSLGAALALALTFVAVDRLGDESVWTINLWYAGLAFGLLLPFAWPLVWSPWALAYGGLGFLGEVFVIWANRRVGPTAASGVAALVPGAAALLAWALYRQPPGGLEALGLVVVVLGCGVLARQG